MRISDWSSDVCSSDLPAMARDRSGGRAQQPGADPDQAGLADAVRPLQQGAAARLHRQVDAAEQQPPAARAGDARQVQSRPAHRVTMRSEEHTSELQSLMRNSYAVF